MTYIQAKQKIDYREGREAEFFFRKWTGASDAPPALESRHIDCIWGHHTVDVKGLKKSHLDGYVLFEFKTVDGRKGWGETGADKIAFQFPEGFYVVPRKALAVLAKKKVLANPTAAKTVVASNLAPSSGLYMMIQRPGRKDLFTYLRKEDILTLDYELVNEQLEDRSR